ncbi:BTAD domain-containing putative transcriptional regulator, partial [Microbacterium sp.]|uniref:AfsR/SARP family transcriptional regulator n=1 Tax=Microbacterium sp. TaxID=51671 RepID=UPI00322198BC
MTGPASAPLADGLPGADAPTVAARDTGRSDTVAPGTDTPAVTLLGPVRFHGAAPRGRSLAVLLALLALETGRPVSMARIVAELWDERPPPSAQATVHVYVSRLRSLLRPHAAVRGGPAGYALEGAGESDAARFARLVDDGYRRHEAGDPHSAADRFDAALTLWRGEPFAGQGGAELRAARARLDGIRRDATIGRARCALALGDARR